MSQSQIIGIGVLLIFLGMLVILAGSLLGVKEKTNVKSAGIVFIGPFHVIGWVSSKQMYYALMALGIILFFVFYFLFRH